MKVLNKKCFMNSFATNNTLNPAKFQRARTGKGLPRVTVSVCVPKSSRPACLPALESSDVPGGRWAYMCVGGWWWVGGWGGMEQPQLPPRSTTLIYYNQNSRCLQHFLTVCHTHRFDALHELREPNSAANSAASCAADLAASCGPRPVRPALYSKAIAQLSIPLAAVPQDF